MKTITLQEARARWARAQGLTLRPDCTAREALLRAGWIRSLGGAEAYLGLAARSASATVDSIHAEVTAADVQIAPTVRGCIYLVPRDHVGLCLTIAERLTRRRNARDLEKAGAREAELDTLGELILNTLEDEPRSTRGLRDVLPEGAIRAFGEAGRKIGLTSTLPPTLRRLEFAGLIGRRQVDDRIDHETYDWALLPESPVESYRKRSDAEVHQELAALFLQWAGLATRQAFASWSGLGQRAAQAALDAHRPVELSIKGEDGVFFAPRDAPADAGPPRAVAWLPAMDGLFAYRSTAAPMVHPDFHSHPVASFGRPAISTLGAVSSPLDRTLAIDGEIRGMWAWSPSKNRIVTASFLDVPEDTAEQQRLEGVFRDLGHGRVFSLDNEAKVEARAERLLA